MSLPTSPDRPLQHGARRGPSTALLAALGALAIQALPALSAPGCDSCAGLTPGVPAHGLAPSAQLPPRLISGFARRRSIRADERHRYSVTLTNGQFLRVVVEQEGADVEVRLTDSKGKPVACVDGPDGVHGDEDLAVLAPSSGQYLLEVHAGSNSNSPPGRYHLRVVALRPVQPGDQMRVEAACLTQEAVASMSGESYKNQLLKRTRTLWRWRDLGELGQVAQALHQMGVLVYLQWGPAGAHPLFHEAVALRRGLRDPYFLAQSLNEAGRVDFKLARFDEARDHFEKAFALTKVSNPKLAARIESNLGYLYTDLGETGQAVHDLTEAAESAESAKDWRAEASALVNLGGAYKSRGEWQKSLDSYQKALEISQEAGDSSNEAAAQNELGVLYQTLGQLGRARDHYQNALAINRRDLYRRARTLNNLGVVDQSSGRTAQAHARFVRSLKSASTQQNHDSATQAAALNNLGVLAVQRNQPDNAQRRCKLSLSLAQEGTSQEATDRECLGMALLAKGDRKAARHEFLAALAVSQKLADRKLEADITLQIARLERASGHLEEALANADAAVRMIEYLRTEVSSQEFRATFLASVQSYYEFSIDTLMEIERRQPHKGFRESALQISERARARSLLETLAEAGEDVKRDLAQPQPLSAKEIQAQVVDGDAMLLEYALGEERSYLWAVTRQSVESFELPGRAQIEAAAHRFYLDLIAPGTHPDGQETSEEYKHRLQDGAALFNEVLGQVANKLGDRPLLVVADGALQYVPFAALPLPNSEPLVTRHKMVNLPSASTLVVLRQEIQRRRQKQAPTGVLAVLADPVFTLDDEQQGRTSTAPVAPLATGAGRDAAPGAPSAPEDEEEISCDNLPNLSPLYRSRAEAREISNFVQPSDRLLALGVDASLATATSGRLASYRYVHFATHGFVDSRRPEGSCLVLSLYDKSGRKQDGRLLLRAVYKLRLNAELVVLSACETALGQEVRGEGLVGLTRGFMYAGAARVLASLWNVRDSPTMALMVKFYSALLRQGLSPAAALQQAQVEMSRKGRSPYQWAGFSLQGEWK
jgi:CHAT domain-containing protein